MKHLQPQPSDQELLNRYHQGDNEPVGIWIWIKYTKPLLIRTRRYSTNNEEDRDVLQDICVDLIEIMPDERKEKFNPKNLLGYLLQIVKNKSIDKFRKEKPDIYQSTDPDDFAIHIKQELYPDNSSKEFINAFLDQVDESLRADGREDDRNTLAVLREFGPGRREAIAEALDLDINTARVRKQRLMRYIKRFKLLTIEQRSTNE